MYIYKFWCCNAWQWVIHCHDCVARRMEDILESGILQSGRVSNALYNNRRFSRCFVLSDRSSFCASTGYLTSLKLYLFMLLGICLCIMCLMPSTWKVRSDKLAKCGWDDAMLASTYPVHRSASQLLRCWRTSCLLSLLSCRLSSLFLEQEPFSISTIVCMHNLCSLKIGTVVAQSRLLRLHGTCISQVSN